MTLPALLGFFLGFGFGVGCALAVMYSIYLGGYRTAVRESLLEPQPERWRRAIEKLAGRKGRGDKPATR